MKEHVLGPMVDVPVEGQRQEGTGCRKSRGDSNNAARAQLRPSRSAHSPRGSCPSGHQSPQPGTSSSARFCGNQPVTFLCFLLLSGWSCPRGHCSRRSCHLLRAALPYQLLRDTEKTQETMWEERLHSLLLPFAKLCQG